MKGLTRLQMENALLLTLTLLVMVGGYAFFRSGYFTSVRLPFAQEILLIFLGSIVTILITALLLNKQTLVELQKEQNLRYFELKAQTFLDFFNRLEELVLRRDVNDADLVHLWFVTHRLAVVASPSVLQVYQKFLEVFNRVAWDRHLTEEDAKTLSEALARLTLEIRRDLIGELDRYSSFSAEHIREIILRNEALATFLKLQNAG